MKSIVLPSWIERAAGLAPRALPPFAFGLARRELSFAAFANEADAGGGRTLLEAQSVPLPEGLFGDGPLGVPVGDRETLAAALRLLLSRLSKAPREASVVLPDAWARGLMIESADLPDDSVARREVLRFRLRKLVPFRAEDLRVEAVAVGDGLGDGSRAFATFANEALCATVEDAFASAGVRVGWLSGATAAIHAGLSRFAGADESELPESSENAPILGLAVVDSDGFTLVLSRAGEPVVWRQKAFTEGLSDSDRERLLIGELRLTRTFLEERFRGARLAQLHLAAPRGVEPFWTRVLGEGLGVAPVRLRAESLGLTDLDSGATGPSIERLALAGAVAREIR